MDIFCTRPHCEQPLNSLADLDNRQIFKNSHQRHCCNCGMPLILDECYLPLKLLKQDEFSAVFFGNDRRTPQLKHCAIERLQLSPSLSPTQSATAAKLFHQEAETLEKLSKHPNIPRVFAWFDLNVTSALQHPQQHLFYLVQEYIEGQNLQAELLAKGHFTEPEVVAILREVARILEFIHFQGAIHRNLQPSNIIRDLQGKIYLTDFGSVKQLVTDLTGVFTPVYAPWEHSQGQAIYPSSDLYALAVTCLKLLTGRDPQDLLDPETNNWIWRTPDLQVSDTLAAILDRMLQHSPTERFESARDILDRLDAAFGLPTLSIAATNATIPDFITPAPSTLFSVPLDPEPLQFDDYSQVNDLQPWNTTIDPPPLETVEDRSVQLNHTAAAIVDPRRRPVKSKQLPILAGILATGAVSLIAIFTSKILSSINSNLTKADPILKQSSSGERILMSFEGNKDTDRFKQLKKAGVLALANQNYAEAITKLQAALIENPNSPETRIYLNNALIGNNKSYTIATSVPIGRSVDRASEMLRGFAQAQTEINQAGDVTEPKIKLKIIDDGDDPKVIESVATAIANQPEILGIVGHNRNDVTMKAAAIYHRNKLAFIAPISTANRLTANNKPYIFRTNANGDTIAEKLVERLVERESKQKVAIFYVPSVATSNEFKTQFTNKLVAKGGKLVCAFSFSPGATAAKTTPKVTFDAALHLRSAKKMGAEAILLLPVGRSSREALQLLKIRASTYPELAILGDTALYSLNTLRAGKKAQGLTIGVPWQESESTPQFSVGARQLWRTQVNWATATSYNSIKAIGTAIKAQEKPSRTSVMTALSKNEFMGASGRFKFVNGESTSRYSLVEVAPTPANYKYSSSTGYDFVPIEEWLF